MRLFLPFALLIAGAGFMQASIIETITLNLSPLHASSVLSGTFALSNSPMIGDTAPVLLSFTDASDYSPASLTSQITISSGTPSAYAVAFSPITFTNLSGSLTPIDTRNVDLTPFAFATCTSFPCTATGGVQDGSPAVFSSTYTITATATPEPRYGLLMLPLLAGIVFGMRGVRRPGFAQSR